MLSSESKDKLSVNFLYEPPPGAKKEREKEDDEPEYKFEWQRRFNAPREEWVMLVIISVANSIIDHILASWRHSLDSDHFCQFSD